MLQRGLQEGRFKSPIDQKEWARYPHGPMKNFASTSSFERAIRWAILSGLLITFNLISPSARAEDATPRAKAGADAPSSADAGMETEVKNLRKRYWAKGDTTELEVIQNRQFKKRGKFRLGLGGGFNGTDPFLSVKQLGGSLGYYFGENWAVQLTGSKYFVSSSSALVTLESNGYGTLLNRPSSFVGAEALFSPLYGKLAFFGNQILYFDFYVLGGLGSLSADNGSSTAIHAGLGQQVYLTKSMAINLELRVHRFKENLSAPKTVTLVPGTETSRTTYSWISNFGLVFLL